jgi:hypothetical protein
MSRPSFRCASVSAVFGFWGQFWSALGPWPLPRAWLTGCSPPSSHEHRLQAFLSLGLCGLCYLRIANVATACGTSSWLAIASHHFWYCGRQEPRGADRGRAPSFLFSMRCGGINTKTLRPRLQILYTQVYTDTRNYCLLQCQLDLSACVSSMIRRFRPQQRILHAVLAIAQNGQSPV